MQQAQEKPGNERRRGGGSFVTLLFVAAVPLAAAVFVLTRVFLAQTDVIAAFVPANAVAYLHAGGRTATDAVLSSSVQMPSGVSPDEVAVFATPGDDGLQWAVIVAWRPPKVPTENERAALGARGAVALDARRYLIGDGSLAVASRVAAAAHAAIADDGTKRRALGLMRSVASIQAYAVPRALLAPETVSALAGIPDAELTPMVAGITLSPSSVRARILPLDAAAAEDPLLGYRAASAHRTRTDLGRFSAQTVIAEESPSFDLAKLFSDVPQAKDHPAPSLAVAAGDALRSSLAVSYVLWLRPEPADGRIGYLLRFPGTGTPVVKKALAHYAAAIDPEQAVLRLPDGDVATEFLLDEASRASKMGLHDATVALGKEPGGSVSVGDDGSGGTIIASSTDLLTEFRASKPSRPRPEDGCLDGVQRSTIVLNDPAASLSQVPQAEGVVRLLGLKTIVVGASGDKEIKVCGYK